MTEISLFIILNEKVPCWMSQKGPQFWNLDGYESIKLAESLKHFPDFLPSL